MTGGEEEGKGEGEIARGCDETAGMLGTRSTEIDCESRGGALLDHAPVVSLCTLSLRCVGRNACVCCRSVPVGQRAEGSVGLALLTGCGDRVVALAHGPRGVACTVGVSRSLSSNARVREAECDRLRVCSRCTFSSPRCLSPVGWVGPGLEGEVGRCNAPRQLQQVPFDVVGVSTWSRQTW